MKNNQSDILDEILLKKEISKELDKKLHILATDFTNNFLTI